MQYDLHVPTHHAAMVDRLVPLACELAAKAGPDGVTIADVRLLAVQRGILTGDERGRQLSYLGAVMRKAGLAKTQQYRRSVIARSHGNPHRIFVDQRYQGAA